MSNEKVHRLGAHDPSNPGASYWETQQQVVQTLEQKHKALIEMLGRLNETLSSSGGNEATHLIQVLDEAIMVSEQTKSRMQKLRHGIETDPADAA